MPEQILSRKTNHTGETAERGKRAGTKSRLRGRVRAFLRFALLYKIAALNFFLAAGGLGLQAAMQISGYRYLTKENLGLFLRHPAALAAGAVFFVLIGLYGMADRISVIYVLYARDRGGSAPPTVIDTIRYTFAAMGRLLRAKGGIRLLIFGFFEEFYASAAMLVILVQTTIVKEIFIYIFTHEQLLAAFILLIIAGGIVCLCFGRILPDMLLEGRSFSGAFARNKRMSWKEALGRALSYVLIQLLYFGLFLAAMAAGLFIVLRLQGILRRIIRASLGRVLLVSVLMTALIAFFGIMNSSVTFFLMGRGHRGEILPPRHLRGRIRRMLPAISAAAAIALMLLTGFHTYNIVKGRYNPNIEYVHKMEITAHRGASRYYPENTMAAFDAAVRLGADWIELDIQQSSDGQLFCMHDAGFGRTCGVNAKSWELDSAQIRTLDAGSFFGPDFAGEPVPFLSDVIDFAKAAGIRLNIELKPTVQQEGMEENLVRMLEEKNFIQECVVTSQKYDSLKIVKELNPAITTVYVMGLAYGNVNRMEAADAFSIRMSSVSDRLVSTIHNAGKQIYVWTVNRRNDMEEMIDIHVDNIITDDISLAKNCVGMERTGEAVWVFIRWMRRVLTA